MKVWKAIRDESHEEEWKAYITVMEEDRQTTVRRKEESGADAVRMDKTWLETGDGFIEKRYEGTAVLPILPQSFEAGWPMPRGDFLAWKRCVACLFSETVSGHQQRRTTAFW